MADRPAKRRQTITARQAEVVGLVARGYTNKQIAVALGITERGVAAQVSRLLKHFGVPNRTGLIAKVVQAAGFGLAPSERPPLDRVGIQAHIATAPEREELLYRHAPFMVAVLRGPEHRFTYVNDLFARTTGFTGERLIGRALLEVFPAIAAEALADRDKAFRNGELIAAEHRPLRWRREDGTEASGTFTYIVHPLRTAGGRIDGLLFIGSDARSGTAA